MIIVITANTCFWNSTPSRLLYAGGRTGIFPEVFGRFSTGSGKFLTENVPVYSLIGLYILSIFLILGSYLFKIPASAMMLLVNQNYVFLYAFIIIAYWKTETVWLKWIFSALSLVSLSFLISGFTWKVIYPIFLIGSGYFRFLRSTDKIPVPGSSASKIPVSGSSESHSPVSGK